jgi:acyl-CoA oxidase
MSDAATATPARDTWPTRPRPEALCRFLDGDHHELKQRVRDRMGEDRYRPVSDLDREEYRAQVLRWMLELAESGETKILFPKEYGGQGDIAGGVSAFEMLGHGDLSLLVKCGVQFGLFGGAVQHLGNEEHRREYLPRIMSGELPGCFAMTETGHGSNVQEIGTTATYDPDAHEFVIHTPFDEARKDYIGNAARDGRMAVVFAQLEVGGEHHGVHAFLGSGSRTAGRRSASRASTTGGSGSTRFACRAPPCSTATRPSATTTSTRARSRTRTAASSRRSEP